MADRFLTTHIGSLPRQEELMQIMFAREDGIALDQKVLGEKITATVNDMVARQLGAGVDIIEDRSGVSRVRRDPGMAG